MKYSVFTYSRKGCETAIKVIRILEGESVAAYCPVRLLEPEAPGESFVGIPDDLSDIFSPIPKLFRPFYGERFADSDAMIFIGACGIAVREIAPFVKSKKTDPAVLCVDDHARFVIPVLSGHIGGANELAAKLAELLGATPVITTATDIGGRFSVDTWATKQGLVIDNMKAAKDISAAILDRDLPICSELPVTGEYPPGTFAWQPGQDPLPLGIYIGWEKQKPFEETLRLIPKVLTVGIGCRKGTDQTAIDEAVSKVFQDNCLDERAVKSAASIDLKSEEEGLLAFCRNKNWELRFYSAEELKSVEGDFTPSEFVKSITGVDNVCERAALMDADKLIVNKTAGNGVTVAVAVRIKGTFFGQGDV